MKYSQPVGAAADAPYVDENPAAGTDGSAVPAAAIEAPQRELVYLITQAGLVPDGADLTQVYQSVADMIAAAVAGISTYGAGDGLEISGADYRVKLNGATLLRAAAGLSLNLSQPNVWAGTQSGTETTIADAATLAWDLADKQEASVTLGGNRLSGTPTNLVNGTLYELLVIQPAAGGPYTLTFSSDFTNVAGVSWSTAANAIDRCVFRANGGKLRLVSFTKAIGGA